MTGIEKVSIWAHVAIDGKEWEREHTTPRLSAISISKKNACCLYGGYLRGLIEEAHQNWWVVGIKPGGSYVIGHMDSRRPPDAIRRWYGRKVKNAIQVWREITSVHDANQG